MELVKMETAHYHHEDEQMRVLYEASYRGCISTLNSLIQQDPLILTKINSRTVFTETPLHISASLGHFEFTKDLLSHKPNLALELDSFRSTALHIASAEGHIDIVKELLLAYDQACMVSDREGRIPLQYGVIKGRLEVVRELVRAKPRSSRILHKGKTVFHLCVEHDHLEILKALVEMGITDTSELLNFKDLDGGNTILHLAVTFKQVETVRYLLSISEIREAANLKNDMGFTASDIVERIPKDLKSLEIQVVFINSGIKFEKKEMVFLEDEVTEGRWWGKIWKNIKVWLDYKGDYLEDMRGNLSMVCTVIATMTFQAALNPPGSYIQQGISESHSDNDGTPLSLSCLPFQFNHDKISREACPGEAILASRRPAEFSSFLIYNTISFISSLYVTLLLVSGVPLKHRVVIWMLSIGMCIALYSLAMAYVGGLTLMTPDCILDEYNKAYKRGYRISVGFLVLVGAYIAVNFVVWAVRKCKIKHRMSLCPRNGGFLSQCASFFG